jgi:hypothetical protein
MIFIQYNHTYTKKQIAVLNEVMFNISSRDDSCKFYVFKENSLSEYESD